MTEDTLIIQYNAAIRKEGGSPERHGGEEEEEGEGLVLEYSSSWILNQEMCTAQLQMLLNKNAPEFFATYLYKLDS